MYENNNEQFIWNSEDFLQRMMYLKKIDKTIR